MTSYLVCNAFKSTKSLRRISSVDGTPIGTKSKGKACDRLACKGQRFAPGPIAAFLSSASGLASLMCHHTLFGSGLVLIGVLFATSLIVVGSLPSTMNVSHQSHDENDMYAREQAGGAWLEHSPTTFPRLRTPQRSSGWRRCPLVRHALVVTLMLTLICIFVVHVVQLQLFGRPLHQPCVNRAFGTFPMMQTCVWSPASPTR
jgi:hypothetical protein